MGYLQSRAEEGLELPFKLSMQDIIDSKNSLFYKFANIMLIEQSERRETKGKLPKESYLASAEKIDVGEFLSSKRISWLCDEFQSDYIFNDIPDKYNHPVLLVLKLIFIDKGEGVAEFVSSLSESQVQEIRHSYSSTPNFSLIDALLISLSTSLEFHPVSSEDFIAIFELQFGDDWQSSLQTLHNSSVYRYPVAISNPTAKSIFYELLLIDRIKFFDDGRDIAFSCSYLISLITPEMEEVIPLLKPLTVLAFKQAGQLSTDSPFKKNLKGFIHDFDVKLFSTPFLHYYTHISIKDYLKIVKIKTIYPLLPYNSPIDLIRLND